MEGGTMTKKRTGPDDVGASLDELVNLTAGAPGPAGSATPAGATTAGPVVEVRLDDDDDGPPFVPGDVYAAGWSEADEAASGRFHDEIERRDAEERANRERRERARAGGDAATKAGPVLATLSGLVPASFDRMEARGRGEEACLPLPWPDVARVLDRNAPAEQLIGDDGRGDGVRVYRVLRPGLHVLVGGTGSGKTQAALSLALEAARWGHEVGYVGLELDEVGVVARLAALEWARGRSLVVNDARDDSPRRPVWPEERWSVLDWPRTNTGREGLGRVRAAVEARLGELPIRLAFGGARGAFTADDFGRVCAEVAASSSVARPGLVVLDFLQLLGGSPDNFEDRDIRTRIARAAYHANNYTRDGRLAVLLVSATARDKYGGLAGLGLGDLASWKASEHVGSGKESGEIEYAATSVLVLARPSGAVPYPPAELGPEGWRDARVVAVAKNRHGGTGWGVVGWDGGAFYPVGGGPNGPGVLDDVSAKVAADTKARNDDEVWNKDDNGATADKHAAGGGSTKAKGSKAGKKGAPRVNLGE
jgi:hypothetical protein